MTKALARPLCRWAVLQSRPSLVYRGRGLSPSLLGFSILVIQMWAITVLLLGSQPESSSEIQLKSGAEQAQATSGVPCGLPDRQHPASSCMVLQPLQRSRQTSPSLSERGQVLPAAAWMVFSEALSRECQHLAGRSPALAQDTQEGEANEILTGSQYLAAYRGQRVTFFKMGHLLSPDSTKAT